MANVVASGLTTRDFKVRVPIVCAAGAARGSYARSVEAQIDHDVKAESVWLSERPS
jgi:hypothetical protein